jgi:hypothetical protein
MRLKQPFLKLPIRFDADALAAEARALPPSAWTPHPTGFVGNEAVRLVTPAGEDSDNIEGPMAATDSLNRCHYVRQCSQMLQECLLRHTRRDANAAVPGDTTD